MIGQLSLLGEDGGYAAFVEKFKPKKTTDDCYTPDAVYDAVAGWVEAEYGISRSAFVRPFYPGGDYEAEEYPEGCAVVDNPPFSIITEIVRRFEEAGVRYFLFAPTLTNLNILGCSHVICGAKVTYENGAVVNTSFVTNLDRWEVRSAPDLREAVEAAQGKSSPELPSYAYPDHVLTAAKVQRWAKRGVDYRLPFGRSAFVRKLDAQDAAGKQVFGGGLLLCDAEAERAAAAEAKAAEARAAEAKAAAVAFAAVREDGAIEWALSERELEVVALLGRGVEGEGR